MWSQELLQLERGHEAGRRRPALVRGWSASDHVRPRPGLRMASLPGDHMTASPAKAARHAPDQETAMALGIRTAAYAPSATPRRDPLNPIRPLDRWEVSPVPGRSVPATEWPCADQLCTEPVSTEPTFTARRIGRSHRVRVRQRAGPERPAFVGKLGSSVAPRLGEVATWFPGGRDVREDGLHGMGSAQKLVPGDPGFRESDPRAVLRESRPGAGHA